MNTTPPHPAVRDHHPAILLPDLDGRQHGFFLWRRDHEWSVAPVTLSELPVQTVGPVVVRGVDVLLGVPVDHVRRGAQTTVEAVAPTQED